MRLTGHEAIEHAEAYGLTLSKYADPVEGAREGLTVEEATEIAREDPGLVYLDVDHIYDTSALLVGLDIAEAIERAHQRMWNGNRPWTFYYGLDSDRGFPSSSTYIRAHSSQLVEQYYLGELEDLRSSEVALLLKIGRRALEDQRRFHAHIFEEEEA